MGIGVFRLDKEYLRKSLNFPPSVSIELVETPEGEDGDCVMVQVRSDDIVQSPDMAPVVVQPEFTSQPSIVFNGWGLNRVPG